MGEGARRRAASFSAIDSGGRKAFVNIRGRKTLGEAPAEGGHGCVKETRQGS